MGSEALVMARYGDVGPYSMDNIYCLTHAQNAEERGFHPQETYHDCPYNGIRGDGHPKSLAVITPKGRYGSIALAADAHGITRAGGHYRVKKGWWTLETQL